MKLIATTSALLILAGSAFAQDAAPASGANSGTPATGGQAAGQASEQPTQPAGERQTAATAQVLVPIDREETPVPALNLMAGQVDDMDVIGSDGEEIGEVSDILGDQNGVPQAVVIEAGGFLGLGEKRIVLMLNRLSLDMGRLRTNLTANEISELPEFSG